MDGTISKVRGVDGRKGERIYIGGKVNGGSVQVF